MRIHERTRRVWEMTRRVGLDTKLKSHSNSASHMGGLGDLDEDRQKLDKLEEQLGEFVEDGLGLGESGCRTSIFSG